MTEAFKMKLSTCPVCHHKLNGSATLNGPSAPPKPGDVTICAYCTAFLRFTADLGMVEMQDKDFDALPRDLRSDMMRTKLHIIRMGGFSRHRE